MRRPIVQSLCPQLRDLFAVPYNQWRVLNAGDTGKRTNKYDTHRYHLTGPPVAHVDGIVTSLVYQTLDLPGGVASLDH